MGCFLTGWKTERDPTEAPETGDTHHSSTDPGQGTGLALHLSGDVRLALGALDPGRFGAELPWIHSCLFLGLT